VRVTKDLVHTIHHWPEAPVEFVLLTFRGNVPLALIHQIRTQSAAPLLVIADPTPEETQIKLWESTLDLLICRPYSANLLLAQIRSLAKRPAGMPFISLQPVKLAQIALNPAFRTVSVQDGLELPLTRLEFRLLYTLMTHAGQVFPPENLIEHVWGYAGEGNRPLVRGLIKRLRAKIEPDAANPQYLLTQPGVGYFFRQCVEPTPRHPV
jgi:DNA-binding response OmpR family regulator